jgi:hypothetical protein
MKKIIVLFALVFFIGINVAPVFASNESVRIVLANRDDDPKKKKETKETKEVKQNKETPKPKECPHQKECKQECHQASNPSTSEDQKKPEEKK